ncbi:MAG TPA: hypothetical protein PLZ56_12325 [Anaerolineae bacterium]|nr:hypothetical protein [Anaerolineae bacterium]
MQPSPPPDHLTWRDLELHRQQEQIALEELEQRLMHRMEPYERRIDSLESVIDQQRGAKALVYFLIASNLLAIIGMLVRAGA